MSEGPRIPPTVGVDEAGEPLDAPAGADLEARPGYDRAADDTKAATGVPELHEVDIPPELAERLRRHRGLYPDRRSASIPALWEVQKHYGWCTPEGIRQAAAVLELTPGFLEGVATFYDMLKLEPAGRHSVMVCTNISCWLRGGDELYSAFCAAAGAPDGGTSPDGTCEVEHFECLGACDIAPMASVDYAYYGPLTPEDARICVEQLRAGEPVLPDKRLIDRPAAGGEPTDA